MAQFSEQEQNAMRRDAARRAQEMQRRVLSLLVGAGSGLLALLVVHYGGSLVGISPVLNPLHLVQSAVLGVPGVILMVVLHFTL